MVLLIFDRKNNKLREINTNEEVTLNDLHRMIHDDTKSDIIKYRREFAGAAEGQDKSNEESNNNSNSGISNDKLFDQKLAQISVENSPRTPCRKR